MKRGSIVLVVGVVAALGLRAVPLAAQRPVVDVSTGEELERALASTPEPVTIRLAPGEYVLVAEAAVDSTCGNCEEPMQAVPITVGARVAGPSVWIEGPAAADAVIVTNAGYGVLVEDCGDFRIKNVTITGGIRDESPDATDAAVVVRRSKARVERCTIRDNIGDADLLAKNVVGIIGVCGREGSMVYVYESRIIRNSWDGIALYRDAEARIYTNVIDGVDRAGAEEAGGGRGVGIGLTWNAKARIERNLVRRYWKGIGVFVDAEGQIVNNVVEEMTAWGISCWDAGKGTPSAAIGGNAIYDCGACGVSISRETELAAGEYLSFTGNAVARTGNNPKYDDPGYYCAQCALAVSAATPEFRFSTNSFFENRRVGDDLPDYDVSEDVFRQHCRRVASQIVASPDSYAARQVFVESSFMRDFAR